MNDVRRLSLGGGSLFVFGEIKGYLLWLLNKRHYSISHLHTTINVLKFYFEQVLGREREFYDLPRPKKPEKLPDVLGESEGGQDHTVNKEFKIQSVADDGLFCRVKSK